MACVLKDFWRFIRRRDSESASILVIDLSEWMSIKDLRQMRDYLHELANLQERNTSG